jgi:hypothetical protein
MNWAQSFYSQFWFLNYLLVVCHLSAGKNLPHSDSLFNVEVRDSDHSRLGKTVMCIILIGRIGLRECGHWWTLPSLQIHTFLGIKHLHSAQIADASFHSSWVNTCLRLSMCIEIFQCRTNFFLTFFKCNTSVWHVLFQFMLFHYIFSHFILCT